MVSYLTCKDKIKHEKISHIIFFFFLFLLKSQAQGLKGLINKITKDTSSTSSISKVLSAASAYNKDTLSTSTIANGLKEALQKGTERGAAKLSSADGFFKDAAIKILMPEEAKKVEQKLRSIGLGKQVDNAILSMNRAAEDASKSAAPIFIHAIKQMSIQDAAGILKGEILLLQVILKIRQPVTFLKPFAPL